MRTWLTFLLLTLFTLTACAAPSSAGPTPTIVRLDRSALTATATEQVAEVAPTTTSRSTPTEAPAAATATPTVTATLPPETTETPIPTATATTAPVQAEIIAAGLNVREGPGMNYNSIGTVAKGDTLTVIGLSADSNWLQIVTAKDQTGWISNQAQYTRVTGSLDNVPTLIVERSNVEPTTGTEHLSGLLSSVSGQGSTSGSQQSAVGGRLVFATRSGGDLYLVNMDGTDLRKLAGGVIDPVVSPDGTQVAYTRWDGANMGALYVLDLASGSERVVAGDIARPKSPTWSQDGQE
ncbi:MAG: SH3 domain-containing protein, partial [Anaerolineae bacterium]